MSEGKKVDTCRVFLISKCLFFVCFSMLKCERNCTLHSVSPTSLEGELKGKKKKRNETWSHRIREDFFFLVVPHVVLHSYCSYCIHTDHSLHSLNCE